VANCERPANFQCALSIPHLFPLIFCHLCEMAISHSGVHYEAHIHAAHPTPIKAHESLELPLLFSATGNHETKSKLSLCGVPHPPDTTNRADTTPALHLSQSPSLFPSEQEAMLWSHSRCKGLGSAAILLLLQILVGPEVLTTRAHSPMKGHSHKPGTSIPKVWPFLVPPSGVLQATGPCTYSLPLAENVPLGW
jgi:hypothetical protein